MKAVVTGGAGFIGHHAVEKFAGSGWDVRSYDRALDPADDVLGYGSLYSAFRGADVVAHLAAIADVREAVQSPLQAVAVNVQGTAYVLEAAVAAGVRRLLYASTVWVYSGCREDEVDERTLLGPVDHLYTATKLAGEQLCACYRDLLEVVVLRFGVPYGPRMRPHAVIPAFVGKAARGEPLTLNGSGEQYRQFVHVEDLAAGIVLAAGANRPSSCYNLDGTDPITIKELAEKVAGAYGVRVAHAPAREGDYGGRFVSSRRAREELGWEPAVPFWDGLDRFVKEYRV